jgi:hypothetical protein
MKYSTEENMDESKKYTAFSLPQRVGYPENKTPLTARADSEKTVSFAAPNFAEIEITPVENRATAGEESGAFFSSILPPHPIQPRVIDPVREKFYEMRRLALNRPFARNDSELFYKQARFMEDFTDDYENDAKFNMYYPYYQNMGYDYLRTYFTWRTKARQGDIRQTSLSYIFLYIYELLSGIGVENPVDGLTKLLAIWKTFSKESRAIDKYLPKWLKDYHVFYELPHSFSGFV